MHCKEQRRIISEIYLFFKASLKFLHTPAVSQIKNGTSKKNQWDFQISKVGSLDFLNLKVNGSPVSEVPPSCILSTHRKEPKCRKNCNLGWSGHQKHRNFLGALRTESEKVQLRTFTLIRKTILKYTPLIIQFYLISSKDIYSTLSLLVATLLSADNLCKQFGPRSGLMFCQS